MLNSTQRLGAPALPSRAQAGLSIIELMVGIAIGLIVVAAATTLMATQLTENRKLLVETQMQQDLRATADMVARGLRRAGALPERNQSGTPSSVETMYVESTGPFPTVVRPNNLATQLTNITGGVQFDYSYLDTSQSPCCHGFKLDNNTIYSRIPGNLTPPFDWQPLTDPKIMKVTRFVVTPGGPPSAAAVLIPCAKPCPAGGGTSCWPRMVVRDLTYVIEAESATDTTIKRAISGHVKVRADYLNFRSGTSAFPLICPN